MGGDNLKILDENDQEVYAPDLKLGFLKPDKVFIRHHDAIAAIAEKWHYAIIKEYPNGGKDLEKVIDVPGTKGVRAWDEYEDIERYIKYTKEELDSMRKPSPDEDRDMAIVDLEYRLSALEAGIKPNSGKNYVAQSIIRLIKNGRLDGLSEKINLLFTTDRISKSQYSDFIKMIAEKEHE